MLYPEKSSKKESQRKKKSSSKQELSICGMQHHRQAAEPTKNKPKTSRETYLLPINKRFEPFDIEDITNCDRAMDENGSYY
ncbi:MAG: hypothetical protein BWY75_02827 [bacterium ADurb.Bin425]|nr:MAG: hypothetical protein BWY75_02827 [bacterium ADurb.Bin425]